jgi:hypothetical protein
MDQALADAILLTHLAFIVWVMSGALATRARWACRVTYRLGRLRHRRGTRALAVSAYPCGEFLRSARWPLTLPRSVRAALSGRDRIPQPSARAGPHLRPAGVLHQSLDLWVWPVPTLGQTLSVVTKDALRKPLRNFASVGRTHRSKTAFDSAARVNVHLASRSPSLRGTSIFFPPRYTVTLTVSPGRWWLRITLRSNWFATFWPSIATMTSPPI